MRCKSIRKQNSRDCSDRNPRRQQTGFAVVSQFRAVRTYVLTDPVGCQEETPDINRQ